MTIRMTDGEHAAAREAVTQLWLSREEFAVNPRTLKALDAALNTAHGIKPLRPTPVQGAALRFGLHILEMEYRFGVGSECDLTPEWTNADLKALNGKLEGIR